MKLRLVGALLCLLALPLQAQLFYAPQATIFDSSGLVEPGASVYFYSPDTATLKNTYTTAALTTANANPLVANGQGRLPEAFLSGVYDIQIKDADGVLIDSIDDYSVGLTGNLMSRIDGTTASVESGTVVSSVTRNGAGDYTLTLSRNLVDYSKAVCIVTGASLTAVSFSSAPASANTVTVKSFTSSSGAAIDSNFSILITDVLE